MDEKPQSDVVILKNYFGYREGDGLAQFSAELKSLSPEDKDKLADGIRNGNLTY
jgi:hypothetical protein